MMDLSNGNAIEYIFWYSIDRLEWIYSLSQKTNSRRILGGFLSDNQHLTQTVHDLIAEKDSETRLSTFYELHSAFTKRIKYECDEFLLFKAIDNGAYFDSYNEHQKIIETLIQKYPEHFIWSFTP